MNNIFYATPAKMHCHPLHSNIQVFKQFIVKCLISISFSLFNGQCVSILPLESIIVNRTTSWATDTVPKRGSCNKFVFEIVQFIIPPMFFLNLKFLIGIQLLDAVIKHCTILL